MTAENERRAAADRDLAVKKASYQSEVNAAVAAADAAKEIERAKQGQTVRAPPPMLFIELQGRIFFIYFYSRRI